jgi:hypothetical protein
VAPTPLLTPGLQFVYVAIPAWSAISVVICRPPFLAAVLLGGAGFLLFQLAPDIGQGPRNEKNPGRGRL